MTQYTSYIVIYYFVIWVFMIILDFVQCKQDLFLCLQRICAKFEQFIILLLNIVTLEHFIVVLLDLIGIPTDGLSHE